MEHGNETGASGMGMEHGNATGGGGMGMEHGNETVAGGMGMEHGNETGSTCITCSPDQGDGQSRFAVRLQRCKEFSQLS